MARMVYGLRSHLLTPYSGMCLYVWYEPYVCTAVYYDPVYTPGRVQ